MGLDTLLARLQSRTATAKTDVSDVAGVQANNDAAFGCYGTATADVSDVSSSRVAPQPDTADTSQNWQTYQRRPAPILACTADTSDTSQNDVTDWHWLLHFADRDPVEMRFSPEVNHAEALASRPGVIAAEPIADRRIPTPAVLTVSDESAIRSWLIRIEETDPAIIAHLLVKCGADADARAYFLHAALESGAEIPPLNAAGLLCYS